MSGSADPFDTYFGLKEELEVLFGKGVDLVMADAVRNPHFAASALASAEVLYAAESAVERQLEIVGEALNRLCKVDPETAQQIPDTSRIIGVRNILAHGYVVIDDDVVWGAATHRVPTLLELVDALLDGVE